jgi:hypothetical protein
MTMAIIITTWLVKSCSLKLLHHQALIHLAKLYTKIKGFSTAELEVPLFLPTLRVFFAQFN